MERGKVYTDEYKEMILVLYNFFEMSTREISSELVCKIKIVILI